MDKLISLRVWAARRHANQTYGDLPYSMHLMMTELVALEFFPRNRRLRQACWGHDLPEDQNVTPAELLAAGFHAAAVKDIMAVTDEPGENRHERKQKTLPKIKARGRSAIRLKLCDRLANVRMGIMEGNARKLGMYREEHAQFKAALYDASDKKAARVWAELDRLLFGVQQAA